ncbi:M20 family metallopeptidase [uncultured Rikenella sp.]|uniref:M20 metallopeptidase family protein n=1 Tax=uncultured Rikenella sp. TaxID=368003 RepID=UPI002625C441|nr:M20 family metallopeptidase [uncultured Rikenella sp.]
MTHDIFGAAQKLAAQATEWRREIHRNAELSFEEHRTSAFIRGILDKYGIPYERVAGTGVLARIDGRVADPKHPVVLRADMDALPITETTGLDFACTTGAMHACGHDMHTAALLGALILLQERSEAFDGTVLGLFQPGEELWPGGASVVLKEGVFDGLEPRAFVGGHVSPELKVGQIGVRSGTFMASTDEIHITVNGRGGHGALPHLLRDPVLAAAAMIVAMQQIVSRNNYAFTPSVLSFGRVIADGATNIIPDRVEMEGTFRTMDEGWRTEAHRRIREVAEQTAAAYGCAAEVELSVGYPCVLNDERLTEVARRVIADTFGEAARTDIPRRMTAEDFGFYSVRYPSVFFRWGVECEVPLHNAAFVADERAIPYGVAMLAAMALKILQAGE